MNKGGFSISKDFILWLAQNVSGKATKVYLVLLYYYHWKMKLSFPPQAKIEELLSYSHMTVHRALAELLSLNLIKIKKHNRHNKYELSWVIPNKPKLTEAEVNQIFKDLF